MDNNPLAYVQESKLGALQIQWFSELALFDFVIKYQTGHSNRPTDALSHQPFNPSCDIESKNETNSDEVEFISYLLVYEATDQYLNSTKIPEGLKLKALNISCAVQSIIEEEDKDEIVSTLNTVPIFESLTPEKMAEEQEKDLILELVYK